MRFEQSAGTGSNSVSSIKFSIFRTTYFMTPEEKGKNT
jgi:hypothetical protein